MATPAVRALRRSFARTEITMLVKPWVAPVFAHSPHVDRVMLYLDGERHGGITGGFRLARDLRERGFQAAVLLQNAFEAAWIAALAGIPARGGFDTDARRLLLTHPVHRTEAVRAFHHTGYYLALLRGLGIACRDDRLCLALGPEDRKGAERLLTAEGLGGQARPLGINPSAAFGPTKQWPADRYARLADRLAEATGAPVLIFGGPEDRSLGGRVASAMRHTAVNLAGRTRLGEAMSLIERCRLFVTNDSGLMHAAAALGTPLVAVFGSTDARITGPLSSVARVVEAGLDCAPCLKARCPAGHLNCMGAIDVDRVFAACLEVMA
jgi:heptosyltransferase-2